MTIRVATIEDLDDANGQLRAATRLYIDTEFHAERRYNPRLYLVQVHVEGGDTWLLDPLIEGLIEGLAEAIRDTPWTVHAGSQDIRLLNAALGGVPADILDTQVGAGLAGSRFPQSYGKLVRQYTGRVLDKSATLSDWSRRPLSDEQIGYAAGDVQLLPDLWRAINDVLVSLDRTEICREACADAQAIALDDEVRAQQWRDLQAVGVMSGSSVAILDALSHWRELRGRQFDQPARSVLSDGLMVELAKRVPATLDVLRANRRFPKGIVKRYGDEIIEVVQRAASRPEWGWPAFIRHRTPEARQLAWLRAYALIADEVNQFAAPLVMPNRILERLVLSRPASRTEVASTLGSWRDRLCGDDLWKAMQGQLQLRLDGSDASISMDDHGDP